MLRGLGFTVTKTIENSVIKQRAPSFVETRLAQSQNPLWHWSLVYDFLIDNPLKPNSAYAYTDLQQLLGFVAARQNSSDDFLFLDPDDNFYGPGLITQTWLPSFPFAYGSIIIVGGNAWQVIAAPPGAKTGPGQPAFGGSTQVDGGVTWSLLGATVGGGWPNPQTPLQLVTDGTNYYSPVQIYRGGQFWEDMTDLTGSMTVYANGTPFVFGATSIATTFPYLSFGGLSISGFSSYGLYINWGPSPPATPLAASFNYYRRVRFANDTEDFEKWANQWWTVGGPEGSRGKGELDLVSSIVPNNTNGVSFLDHAPAPPIPLTAGATQRVFLQPTAVSIFQRSDVGTVFGSLTNKQLTLIAVGLGSPKPAATFSGYALPPGVPIGAVKGVYDYVVASGISETAYNAGISYTMVDARGTEHFGGPKGPSGTVPTPWNNMSWSINAYVGGTYDFSAITQNITFGASLPNFNLRDIVNIIPQIVVDY